MRVIFNHITIGIMYRDFWRLVPAFIGTYISLFYQLINLYGLLPAIGIVFLFLSSIITIFSYTLHIISFFLIPIRLAIFIILLLVVISFLTWLLINININRQHNFKIFKLNYASYTAFLILNNFLCRGKAELPTFPHTIFLDVHFKPSLAGNIKNYDKDNLISLIKSDYEKLGAFSDNLVLYGITPGNLTSYLKELDLDNNFQVYPTIIPPKHAKVFGLTKDFFFHILFLKKP